MKTQDSSNVKTWRCLPYEQNENLLSQQPRLLAPAPVESQDLFLACWSFLLLLGVAVADAALRM